MKERLLVVDDEPMILKSLQRLFSKTDYTVFAASSPYEALEIIREHPVAVLISDYTMPNLNGAELLSLANTIRPEMYSIVLSGNGDQLSVIRSMNEGQAKKFLNKPWNDQELLDATDDAYREWSSQRESLHIPRFLNQNSFLKALDNDLKNPCLTDYVVFCFEIQDLIIVRQTFGMGEEKRFLRCLMEQCDATARSNSTLGLMDDNKLCGYSPLDDSLEHANLIIKQLIDSFPSTIVYHDQVIPLRFFVGYATSNAFSHTGADLMNSALIALHNAANEGRDVYVQFSRSMQMRSTRRLTLKGCLNNALDQGEFSLHYQPKITLSDHSICGAEALLRWNNPGLGNISPHRFIPLAEESGLIDEIGHWVMQVATGQWVHWQHAMPGDARISVNVSVLQLADPHFVTRVAQILSATGVAGVRL